jgi:hypothetical protein
MVWTEKFFTPKNELLMTKNQTAFFAGFYTGFFGLNCFCLPSGHILLSTEVKANGHDIVEPELQLVAKI